ncbi:MAG: hypothetical protein KDB00_03075 [Planctomycetales bacterium]|nr:hypothetical protein [Planctomycetales bacterium]
MKQLFGCLLLACVFVGPIVAGDWDANDDSFDPNIHSVVIGDRSWLGDPSPFVFTELSRRGYTHVNATNYEGFDPSVAISLMVPNPLGDTSSPHGGMLMMNKDQTLVFIKHVTDLLKAEEKDSEKRIEIKSAFKGADWALVSKHDDSGQLIVQLENKTADKTDVYRFTANASKKLLGAIRHSLKKLDAKDAPQ